MCNFGDEIFVKGGGGGENVKPGENGKTVICCCSTG